MDVVNDGRMVAACGMNCTYCYAHQRKKKPCPGCRFSDDGKPEHCRKCKIKDCAAERQVRFCSDCSEYPCILINRLDKSYRTRYGESLVRNMEIINEKGMEYYLRSEENRLKCPKCNGILNVHHKKCANCGSIVEVAEIE